MPSGVSSIANPTRNRAGGGADAYLYCTEVTCPECGWRVPLAPSWVVGKGSKTVVRLIPDRKSKRFGFEVCTGVSDEELQAAADAGTAKDAELVCPGFKSSGAPCASRTPIKAIRGDGRGSFGESRSLLRGWENKDVVPRENDIFGERLYVIRWEDAWTDESGKCKASAYFERRPTPIWRGKNECWNCSKSGSTNGRGRGSFHRGGSSREPKRRDFNASVAGRTGIISSRRGNSWSMDCWRRRRWRKLCPMPARSALTLGVGRCADYNSRLCRWHIRTIGDKSEQTFSNQALNTLCNYATRSLPALNANWFARIADEPVAGTASITVCDGRMVDQTCDLWITDPPYADAVNYEEISELFLAWYHGRIPALFPNWYGDSKRALAIKGNEDGFRSGMVDSYRRMAESHARRWLPGCDVHAPGRRRMGGPGPHPLGRRSSGGEAWCIATETTSDLKEGNYVQGTVLLVLRKQTGEETAFLDEVYQEVEAEVHRQLDTMKDLDDAKDPNFGDTDYQLAAYAAALRVLTSKRIEEIDVAYELDKETRKEGKIPGSRNH